MQSVHFAYSAGGLIGPQIAKPFIANPTCVYEQTDYTDSSVNTSETLVNTTHPCVEKYGESHVHWAYLLTGVGLLLTVIPFLLFHCLLNKYNTYVDGPLRAEKSDNPENENGEHKTNGRGNKKKLTLKLKVLFVAMLMLLISFHACTEGRFAGYFTTFNDEYLMWPKKTGMDISSVFWGSFAAGRFIAIPISYFLAPANMIGTYLFFLLASVTAFLVAAVFRFRWLVWVCSALIGFTVAPVFPAIFTWTSESILTVTGKVAATYLIGASGLNIITTLLYGYLMDNFSHMFFCYLLLVQCVVSCCVYISLRVLIMIYIKPRRK